MGRLNRLDITTRASRNTAMLHLSATVPPAVFASVIGISTGAATKWAEYAGSGTGRPTPPSARRPPPGLATKDR